MLRGFFGNLIFVIIARMLCENHLNIENERFIVECSRCRQNLKFGNIPLLFGRVRQRILLKCVPHVQCVQHDYISSFIQSDNCFLALSLPLRSSLLKLPFIIFGTPRASGARFTKVPTTFRARKAIRQTPTRLFFKACLIICCKGNKN